MTVDELQGEATTDVVTAARVLVPNASRSAAYAMAKRGEIPTLRCGRQLRVPVPRLLAMLGITPNTTNGPPRGPARHDHRTTDGTSSG